MKAIKTSEATQAGYYWWLPEFLLDHAQDPNSWQVVSWHPNNPTREKAGIFVGPLTPPTTIVFVTGER